MDGARPGKILTPEELAEYENTFKEIEEISEQLEVIETRE